ncbi:hypothetical protein E8E11_010780 [Didymella keratinophila]|nr:hypothetical protein E8E11_010780 [Didymella keratinophila]
MSVSRCVSTARRSRSLQAVNHLRSGIEGLTGQQEELEETREEVLIGRETLRKLRQALREQRARTANAEIALMNGFRQHYNHGGDQIPADLVTAYASVDEERNKLGTMEDVYLEAEEDQAALEWTLTELETNLYQSGLRQLLDDSIPDDYAIATPEEEFVAPKPRASIPPSTVIQYQVATQELEQLVDRFQTLRQHISNRIISETDLGVPDADLLDLDTNEFVQSFLDLLDRISQSQVKVQHLKSELIHRGTEMTVVDRRFSEPVPRIPGENIYSDLTRTLSDGSTAHLEDGTFVAHHIRDWLLNCLRENAVQRVQYLGILHQTLSFMEAMLPDLTHWEMLARKHWALDLTDQMDASVVVVPSPSQEANNRFDMDLQEFQDADPSHLGPKTPLLYGLNSPSLSWTEAPAYTHTPGSAALEDETMDLDLEDSHLYERDLATANEETLQHSDTCQEHHENHLNGIPQVRVADCCAARCDSAHNSVRGEHHLETPLSQSQNVEEQQPVLVSDITTLSGTTIAPIVSASAAVDLTYSEWQWSPVLQREVCYAFGPEDTIIEVMWLNPVPKNDEDVPSVQLSSHSTEQTRR